MLSSGQVTEQDLFAQTSCQDLPILTECYTSTSVNWFYNVAWLESRPEIRFEGHGDPLNRICRLPSLYHRTKMFTIVLGKK